LPYINGSNAGFFSIRRESSIEKEEGLNSVRREEAAKRLVAIRSPSMANGKSIKRLLNKS